MGKAACAGMRRLFLRDPVILTSSQLPSLLEQLGSPLSWAAPASAENPHPALGAQFLPRGWERLHGGCPDDEAAGNWEGGPRCLRAEGWAVPGVGEGGPREVTPGLTKMTVTSLGRRRWLGQGQEDSTSPSGLCGRSSGVGVPIIAYSSLGLAACLRERTPQLGDPRHGARVLTTSRHCTEWGAPELHRLGCIGAAQDAGAPAGRPLRPIVSRRPGPSSQWLLSGGGSYSPASWDCQGPKSTRSANATGREGESTTKDDQERGGRHVQAPRPRAQSGLPICPAHLVTPLPLLPLPLGCGCGQSWE